MLKISYAQCLADPTYCDTGKAGGRKLTKLFGVEDNQSRPLREILPLVTVAEALWCLRAVSPSQRVEAYAAAWKFIEATLARALPNRTLIQERYVASVKNGVFNQAIRMGLLKHLEEEIKLEESPVVIARSKILRAALSLEPQNYSQIAVDVSAAAIQYARFNQNEKEEEQAQRYYLEQVL